MGQFFDSCPETLFTWIRNQHIFFVATGPLSPSGHVNVSPKGAFDCFHLVGPNKIWYEDLTGSGNETIAHLRENGRITVMFVAFDGLPRIVRFFGTGAVHEVGSPEYNSYIDQTKRKPGSRAIVVVDVHKVGTSCGYSIPFYDFKRERTQLMEFFSRLESKDSPEDDIERVEGGIRQYWATKNASSFDGLPGFVSAPSSTFLPSNSWSKEDEIVRSEARAAATSKSNRQTSKRSQRGFNVQDGGQVAVAFFAGVFATLACMNAFRSLSRVY